jgi:D-beta-D-heptose 7-phosphate kinase / D-beta-D-heptose 1-phosphate adenosyltransferase
LKSNRKQEKMDKKPLTLTGNIIVIGDVMLDVYISGQAHRLSPEAPVPVVAVDSKTATLGGAGNVALNLAHLGCKVWLFGVKGDDAAGRKIVSILFDNGIENRLVTDYSVPTITKTRVMANSQQLLRFDEEKKASGSGMLTEINGALEGDAQAVILSDYAKGILSPDLIAIVIKRSRAKGIPVFIDPKRGDWHRYHGANVIKPNLAELEEATGETISNQGDVVRLAIRMIRAYELEAMLVTMGPRGMMWVTDQGQFEHIPTQAKEVFDVSGAGDTVIATLAACMVSGHSLSDAAKIANAAAGIVVGKLGTRAITLPELNQTLEEKC